MMRRIAPAVCDEHLRTALAARQTDVDAGTRDVRDEWKSFSKTTMYENLCGCLEAPLGSRKRCAYCSDSRAADVEHFWPKVKYPTKAFSFENFLFICPECNRKKSSRFPLDSDGLPLLVNPMFDDPWDSLFFVPTTGMITPRIVEISNDGPVEAPRGEKTLSYFGEILNSDALLDARKESWAEIVSMLSTLLSASTALPTSQYELFGSKDLFGLGEFLINREGKEDVNVRELRERFAPRWLALRELPRFPV